VVIAGHRGNRAANDRGANDSQVESDSQISERAAVLRRIPPEFPAEDQRIRKPRRDVPFRFLDNGNVACSQRPYAALYFGYCSRMNHLMNAIEFWQRASRARYRFSTGLQRGVAMRNPRLFSKYRVARRRSAYRVFFQKASLLSRATGDGLP